MAAEILIPFSFFLFIFGICYVYFTTRNKERLALIEKGADATIFFSKKENAISTWKVIVVNVATLLIGIGAAIFIAGILVHNFGIDKDVAYPGMIFFMAGIGLLSGFFITKKLEK